MQQFLIRRGLYVVLMLVMVSIVGFIVINLPPGDFMDAYLARMQSSGTEVDKEMADNLRRNYGLDKPLAVQYLIWFSGVLRGDFGWSFDHQIPVSSLVKERIALTLVISLCTLIMVYAAAIPIGIVSAVKQYSLTDYTVTLFGFIGLATPNFLLALLLMYLGFQWFGADVGGLFSNEYVNAPWSLAKLLDLLQHLWVPVVVLGTAGTAGIIRVMRAHPARRAAQAVRDHRPRQGRARDPSDSQVPGAGGAEPRSSAPSAGCCRKSFPAPPSCPVVLSLPTTGQLLLRALRTQDMYLAGSLILLLELPHRDRHADFRPAAGGYRPAHQDGVVVSGALPPGAVRVRAVAQVGDAEAPQPGPPAPPDDNERYFIATQRQLIWRAFKRHRLALISSLALLALYLTMAFAEFLGPYAPFERKPRRAAPTTHPHPPVPRGSASSGRSCTATSRPWTCRRCAATTRRTVASRTRSGLLQRGSPYRMWGLFDGDLHLFGVDAPGLVYLLGTDDLGRDMFSRITQASRISLSIGLVGVALSFLLGASLGAISGYFGGAVDTAIQRIIELLRSVPTIPLWMGLAAAIPPAWSMQKRYFGITVIISLVAWTSLARVVRGKFLELREADFVAAGRLAGATDVKIILSHMLPGFMSYLIVNATLAIPNMILGETSLSFLGLGLQRPVLSWGVLLQNAQNVRTMAVFPWLMSPVLFVIVAVLLFNFVGDGLRDAADPYKR